jgi:hypothetical protein
MDHKEPTICRLNICAALMLFAMASSAMAATPGGDVLFHGTAKNPRLRHYSPDGRLSLDVRGKEGGGAAGGYQVTAVRFQVELDAKVETTGAVAGTNSNGQGDHAIRFVKGQADLALYDRSGGTLRLNGNVGIELHSARPVPIKAGGAVGFPPTATLHVSQVRYNLETNIISSNERVWALFQGESGTTEVTGRGLEINLTSQTLRIFEDARFIVGGNVLSAATLLRTDTATAANSKPKSTQPTGLGARITARHGALIEGLGVRADRRNDSGHANARAVAPARRVRFNGPVSVRQDDLSLRCNALLFSMENGGTRIRASGDVRLRARERGAALPVDGFLAEAHRAQWELPGKNAKDKRGILRLEGTAKDPAEIVRRGIGQNVAARMRLDLDTGAIEAGE